MNWVSNDISTLDLTKCCVYYREKMNSKAWKSLSKAVTSTNVFYSFRNKKRATAIVFVSDTLILEI